MNITLAGGSVESEAPATPEDQVRSTLEPVRHDDSSAQMQESPDYNEYHSDESGELTGLTRRQVASDTHEREKYRPWWRMFATNNDVPELIDARRATVGTAAAREEAGEQGHGTMQYAVGIEPQIRDGARFGNDYFVTHDKSIQEGAGAYMQPDSVQNNWASQVAAARASEASRKAYLASQYKAFLG